MCKTVHEVVSAQFIWQYMSVLFACRNSNHCDCLSHCSFILGVQELFGASSCLMTLLTMSYDAVTFPAQNIAAVLILCTWQMASEIEDQGVLCFRGVPDFGSG